MSIGNRPTECKPTLNLGLLHVGLTRNVDWHDAAILIPVDAQADGQPPQTVLYTDTPMGKMKHEPECVTWTRSYDTQGNFTGPPSVGLQALGEQMQKKQRREGRPEPREATP